jgi:hypothetical protein
MEQTKSVHHPAVVESIKPQLSYRKLTKLNLFLKN